MDRSNQELLARIQALEVDVQRRERRSRQVLWTVGIAAALGIIATSRPAWSQACADTLPEPLATFCAGQPARAAEINGNFQQLYDWLSRKVGDPTDGRVVIAAQDEALPLGKGGSLIIGSPEGANLAVDSNEIVARNGGKGSTLLLQTNQGAGNTAINVASGNLGVGTAEPGAKLDVNGGIQLKGDLKNASSNGVLGVSSDFAFSDTGDSWLRLKSGTGSTRYANLAVGQLSVEQRLIRMLLLKMGNDNEKSTGVSDKDWDCWVGGFEYLDGNINENGGGNIVYAYTYLDQGVWHVRADFRSHHNHESHNIRVVCARDAIVQRDSW